MRELAKALMCAAMLAGCSSSTPPTPIAASGFAQSGDEVAARITFNVPQTSAFVLQDEKGALINQDVSLRINAQGRPMVVIDGQRFVLNSEGNGIYSTTENDTNVLWLRISQTDPNAVELIYLSFATEDSFNAGYVPFGFDTNPTTVAAETGSAVYTGPASLSLRQVIDGRLASGFSNGTARITADFDGGAVNGSIRFDDPADRPIEVADVTLQLEGTAIRDNTFSGSVSVAAGSFGDGNTLSSGTYDGRFFGADVGAVGGTLTGTVVTGDPDRPILLQGGFIGEQ